MPKIPEFVFQQRSTERRPTFDDRGLGQVLRNRGISEIDRSLYIAQTSGSLPVRPSPVPASPVGSTITVRAPLAPSPIYLPPIGSTPGPSGHPAMPRNCGRNIYYGDPPTRRRTTGRVLTPAQYTAGISYVNMAIRLARTEGHIHAADNLEHWKNGTGSIRWMPHRAFSIRGSGLWEHIENDHLPQYIRGIQERVRRRSHPQGHISIGGSHRFLHFRSGTRPFITQATDLAIGVGAYNVHTAMWVSGHSSSGSSIRVRVERWCAQIYDSYDWVVSGTASTTFPVGNRSMNNIRNSMSSERFDDFVSRGYIRQIPFLGWLVTVPDDLMKNLEVTGTPTSYLIFTQPFDIPTRIFPRRELIVQHT